MLLRCLGGRCLTITAITIALSAANNPSKNTSTKSTHINKVKSNSDPLWTTPFSLNINKETYANLIAKVSLSNIFAHFTGRLIFVMTTKC